MPDTIGDVIDRFEEQDTGDELEDELEVAREFFDRVADCEPSPADRDAAVAVVTDSIDWLTKRAARRELSKARGVDRDRS